MSSKKKPSKEIQRLFREKQRRRQELARLPFEKKIQILVELQKIASGVSAGKKDWLHSVWKIHL